MGLQGLPQGPAGAVSASTGVHTLMPHTACVPEGAFAILGRAHHFHLLRHKSTFILRRTSPAGSLITRLPHFKSARPSTRPRPPSCPAPQQRAEQPAERGAARQLGRAGHAAHAGRDQQQPVGAAAHLLGQARRAAAAGHAVPARQPAGGQPAGQVGQPGRPARPGMAGCEPQQPDRRPAGCMGRPQLLPTPAGAAPGAQRPVGPAAHGLVLQRHHAAALLLVRAQMG